MSEFQDQNTGSATEKNNLEAMRVKLEQQGMWAVYTELAKKGFNWHSCETHALYKSPSEISPGNAVNVEGYLRTRVQERELQLRELQTEAKKDTRVHSWVELEEKKLKDMQSRLDSWKQGDSEPAIELLESEIEAEVSNITQDIEHAQPDTSNTGELTRDAEYAVDAAKRYSLRQMLLREAEGITPIIPPVKNATIE